MSCKANAHTLIMELRGSRAQAPGTVPAPLTDVRVHRDASGRPAAFVSSHPLPATAQAKARPKPARWR